MHGFCRTFLLINKAAKLLPVFITAKLNLFRLMANKCKTKI